MPDYNWECQVCGHGCSSGADACVNCGCPANVTAFEVEDRKSALAKMKGTAAPDTVKKQEGPAVIALMFISGCYLVIGSAYQIITKNWFPGFPPIFDAIYIFTKELSNKLIALYVSSVIISLIGILLVIGCIAAIKKQKNVR